jgi:lysophospholipase L1-like esterase
LNRILFATLLLLFVALSGLPSAVTAAPTTQQPACRFFTETGAGQGGFSVCDDGAARFRAAFERWGLQQIGYPISRRYERDGFVTQAFQKAIMQWRPDTNSVALVNVFDDLNHAGFDETLFQTRQTPRQLPPGWDGAGLTFQQVVEKRQALLNARPALRAAYFASSDPLTFFGLPTSEVTDVGNHYAIRLQRAVLQEWREDVPWARAGQVTIANGGDIAKELGALPSVALVPEPGPSTGAPPAAPPATTLEYTALGDSLATGAFPGIVSYVERYRTALGTRSRRTVALNPLARNGWTSGDLLNALRDDPAYGDALARSQVVTWDIGGNDLLRARSRYKAGTCGGTDNQDCLRSTVQGFKSNWDAILAEILARRSPNNTVLRTMDLFNPYVSRDQTDDSWAADGGLNDYQVFKPYLDDVNRHIATTATRHGIAYAKVSEAFNGPQGNQDPLARGYLSLDRLHPSNAGHQRIADLLDALGYAPLLP